MPRASTDPRCLHGGECRNLDSATFLQVRSSGSRRGIRGVPRRYEPARVWVAMDRPPRLCDEPSRLSAPVSLHSSWQSRALFQLRSGATRNRQYRSSECCKLGGFSCWIDACLPVCQGNDETAIARSARPDVPGARFPLHRRLGSECSPRFHLHVSVRDCPAISADVKRQDHTRTFHRVWRCLRAAPGRRLYILFFHVPVAVVDGGAHQLASTASEHCDPSRNIRSAFRASASTSVPRCGLERLVPRFLISNLEPPAFGAVVPGRLATSN